MTTVANSISAQERAQLLDELSRLRSDADQLDGRHILERFLPVPGHDRALSRDIMIVRGERGAGKSMLFKVVGALVDAQQSVQTLFPRADQHDALWIEGFSETSTLHPSADLVGRFVANASPERVRVMWMAQLVGALYRVVDGLALPPSFQSAWNRLNDIDAWVSEADRVLPELTTCLDALNTSASSRRSIVVLYDHLDKIGTTDRAAREKATASLLALWLSLSNRYDNLRAKIFVREDLFEASLSGSADASKLRSRSIALGWNVGSLYRLLIRQMAAQSPAMRAWIESTLNRVSLEERSSFGWFPPDPLPEHGRPSYAGFIEHLAGRQMGKGLKKGYVYRWIPDRLQDAHGAIVPRSLVNLVAYAAEHARHSPKAVSKRLLHPLELHAALDQTSKQRVDELGEEHVVVYRLEHLSGMTVPIERATLVAKLARPSNKVDPFSTDGESVVGELERLGVLRRRPDGRWDVPDLYRYGYSIKRKGGVARPS